MSTRHGLLVGLWVVLILAAAGALAQTAPPGETPARGEPPARPGVPEPPPGEAAQASDVARQLPPGTVVDAPARSREQAGFRLQDVLRTVPGITPR